MTLFRHAVLHVLIKKYYFSARTRIKQAWTWFGHSSDVRQMWLDTAQIWLDHDLVLFSNYLMDQKRIQRPKNLNLFRNLFF